MLLPAITTITLALILYTIGVWGEKLQKRLNPWHVVIFWLGLVNDTIGTALMEQMSQSETFFNFHGITGAIAILLMLFHAVWATFVLVRKNEVMMEKFHKFSVVVWIIWLIPYLSGAATKIGG